MAHHNQDYNKVPPFIQSLPFLLSSHTCLQFLKTHPFKFDEPLSGMEGAVWTINKLSSFGLKYFAIKFLDSEEDAGDYG